MSNRYLLERGAADPDTELVDYSCSTMNNAMMSLQVKYTNLTREVAVAIRLARVRDSSTRGLKAERVAWELITHTFPDTGQYSTLDTLIVQYAPTNVSSLK